MSSLREGWIEKRSQYLHQWRKRWLVVTADSLSTYKRPDYESQTLFLKTKEIENALPCEMHTDTEFSFEVQMPKQKIYFTASSDKEMCEWLNVINQARREFIIAECSLTNHLHEQRLNAEVQVSSAFTVLKDILSQREAELLQVCSSLFNNQHEAALSILADLNESSDREEKRYAEMQHILVSNESTVQQMIALKKLEKVNALQAEFTTNLPELSLQAANAKKLIQDNFSVSLKNPYEHRVRRTNITRALKWRYNGDRVDALSFIVSEDLALSGVGICMPYKTNGVTHIKSLQILKGNRTDSVEIYRHPVKESMKHTLEDSVFKIHIKVPVFLNKNVSYTVVCCMQGSQTYKCVECFSEARVENVLWRFSNAVIAQLHNNNRCDVMCGPIADFYFIQPKQQ